MDEEIADARADAEKALPQLLSELWAEVLQRVPHAEDIAAATQACKVMRDAYREHKNAILNAMLTSPRVQPYCESTGFPTSGTALYKAAMRVRHDWSEGNAVQALLSFNSYVRCLKVDWVSSTVFVGLYDGSVWCRALHPYDEEGPPRRVGSGGHAVGEVLCIDVAEAVVLSGSGEPSYYSTDCPHATLRIVSIEMPPFRVIHELGPKEGGHSDSLTAILVTEGPTFEGGAMRCTAVTASADGSHIVWDVAAGKALFTCAWHGGAVTAMARVDEESILSCSVDGTVCEWRWRTGSCVRWLSDSLKGSQLRSMALSCMSFHAATSTFALGDQQGRVSVWRLNPRREDHPEDTMSCYPLTRWKSMGANDGGEASSNNPANEVAAIQHDGDKLVCATRRGVLRVVRLGELPDEGMPFGIFTWGELARNVSPSNWPDPPMRGDVGVNVRMYVSTVAYRGHVLVGDGFDNRVAVIEFGDG